MRDRILANALHLLVNAGATMALGFVFWWMAARIFEPSELGLGTATVSAMLLLGLGAKVGFDVTLVRVLQRASREDRDRALDSFATGTAVLGVLLGIAFVAAAHAAQLEVARALVTPWSMMLFVVGVVAVAELTMIDGLFLSEERAELVTWKNAGVAGLKAVLLVPFALVGAAGVAGAWAAAAVVTLAAVVAYVSLSPDWRWRPRMRADPRLLASSGRVNAGNFMVQMAEVAPTYLLPLVVAQALGTAQAGFFYVAWTVASLLYFVPQALALSFLASASRATDEVDRVGKVRRAVGYTALLVVPASIVAFPLGPFALGVFGDAYAAGGVALYGILVVAAPFVAVNFLWTALLRVRDRAFAFSLFAGGIVATTLVLLVPLTKFGIVGVGYAWLGANALFAIGALPGLVKETRGVVLHQSYATSAARSRG